MANVSNNTLDVINTVFIFTSMDLPLEVAFATIILGLAVYLFSLVSNLIMMMVIVYHKKLHEPMYIFLCNLFLCDIIGISALLPRSIYDLIYDYRLITFPACFVQAWCLHVYGTETLLLLSIMAFDRYVAICHPLRYHAIMSKNLVVCLIVSSWIIVFIVMGILFGLTLQYPFCRRQILSTACDNMSILKLTCATDITVNNIYGLVITAFFHGFCIFSVLLSYSFILVICYKGKDSESRAKAWHTCGTHLTVFLLYEISSGCTILSHRIPNNPPTVQKIAGLLYITFQSLNPIIYGLKTKEIKGRLFFFCNKIFNINVIKIKSLV